MFNTFALVTSSFSYDIYTLYIYDALLLVTSNLKIKCTFVMPVITMKYG